MAVRNAWHSSGTFDKSDSSGGSNLGRILFSPEKDDGANAGLNIVQEMIRPVKQAYPEVSFADLFTLGGALAVEYSGGPKIAHRMGRADATPGTAETQGPDNGRLPDASQGAQHLRDVFY